MENSTESAYKPLQITTLSVHGIEESLRAMRNPRMSHEKSSLEADLALAGRLIRAGDEHAKCLRGCVVWAEAEFQIGWMVEWNTYRIGVEVLSTSSTMYMDHSGLKGAELAAAKQANLPNVVYHQNFTASYQALRRIWRQRKNHRHPDWRIMTTWIETMPYAEALIFGSK